MEFLILGAILFLRVVQSVTGKSCSRLMPTDSLGLPFYLSIRMGLSAAAALVAFLLGGSVISDIADMSALGWLISVATGTTIFMSTSCSLLAMKNVSIVLSSLFSTAGLLIPTVAGIFLYGQNVKPGQWGGVALLFVAAVLLSMSSGKTNGKITPKAVLLLFGCTLSNGGTMLLQTLYRTYVPQGSVSLFSFMQFFVPCVVLLAFCRVKSGVSKTKISFPDKKLLGYTVFASLTIFGISQISTVASSIIPVAVLFPVSDGGGTVISAIVAATVFKERLTVKSTLGVILGIAAVMMIKFLG